MIKYCKVYLKGAYGPGNLGDDVLLMAILNILKQKFHPTDITVGVEEPENARFLDPSVNWTYYKKPYRCDLVVYGGGGQFFDFDFSNIEPNKKIELITRLVSGIKKQKSIFDVIGRLIVKARGGADGLLLHKKAISYCIGMGPFQKDGFGTFRAKKYIRDSNFTILRDHTSLDNYLKLGGSNDLVKVFSDPSFNIKNWYFGSALNVDDSLDLTKPLVYVVRYWPYTSDGQSKIDSMIEHARAMKSKGYSIKLVSLDKNKDFPLIQMITDLDWLIYDYKQISISDFIQKMVVDSSVIFSARAHGVWLSVLLGKPTIAVGIEPKLKEVHKSLPNSTLYTECDDLHKDMENYVSNYTELNNNVSSDVNSGREKSIACESFFHSWLGEQGL